VSLQDLRNLADGITTVQGFLTDIEVTRLIASDAPVPVWQVLADVAEIRELGVEAQVPYELLSAEDLTERLEEEIEEEESDALLVLLGAVSPDADLEQMLEELYSEQVSGYYDMEEKKFFVLEREEETAMERITTAHELAHALQDQHFGLEEHEDAAETGDESLAFRALAEGDAMLTSYLYADEHIPVIDLWESMYQAGSLEQDALDTSPLLIRETLLFPYAAGLQFVASLYETGGWEAVDGAYENPPKSTEQVLHIDKYREEDEPQEVPLPDLAAALGGDWREIERDVLGELGLRLALGEHMGLAAAQEAAEGWGGDIYVLLREGDEGDFVLVMRSVWDEADEAEEFWRLYRLHMAHRYDFREDVRELVGEPTAHWWQSENHWSYASQDEEHVTIVVSTSEQAIESVVEALAAE
jgi:hypothetical protein